MPPKKYARAAVVKDQTAPLKRKASNSLDALEADGQSGPKRRQLKMSSSDAEVRKIVRDNFTSKGYPVHLVDEYEVEGRTLRQDLKFDRATGGDSAKGGPYYDLKREKFTPPESASKMLKVVNIQEALDSTLEKALGLALQHNPKYEALQDWLSTAAIPNQRTYVFLLRGTLKIPAIKSGKACNALIEIALFHQRTQVHMTYTGEFEIAKDHLEGALILQLDGFRSTDQTGARWWNKAKGYACPFVPKTAIETLMSVPEGTGFETFQKELIEVVKSGPLGVALFGSALKSVGAKQLVDECISICKRLCLTDITPATFASSREDFLLYCRQRQKDANAAHKPTNQSIPYRGNVYPVSVMSAMALFKMVRAAAVRTVAVDGGLLKPLYFEKELFEGRAVSKIKVEKSLLEGNVQAREAAEDFCAGIIDKTALTYKGILEHKKKFNILLQYDDTFVIEKAVILGTIGAVGDASLRDQIIAALPSTTNGMTTLQSLAKIDNIGRGRLLQVVGIGMQSVFLSVQKAVQALDTRHAPVNTGSNTPFMKTVFEHLSSLCSYKGAPITIKGVASVPVLLFGKAAAAAMFVNVKAKIAAAGNDPTGFGDTLERLQMFFWLLDDSSNLAVVQWKNKLQDSVTTQCLTGGSSSSGSKIKAAAPTKMVDGKPVMTQAQNVKEMLRMMSL
jgi:hypothetical protein